MLSKSNPPALLQKRNLISFLILFNFDLLSLITLRNWVGLVKNIHKGKNRIFPIKYFLQPELEKKMGKMVLRGAGALEYKYQKLTTVVSRCWPPPEGTRSKFWAQRWNLQLFFLALVSQLPLLRQHSFFLASVSHLRYHYQSCFGSMLLLVKRLRSKNEQ